MKNMGANRSEMGKVANPVTHAFNRESYFTDISFDIRNKPLKITTKIDTGATYTVIGLYGDGLEDFKKEYHEK